MEASYFYIAATGSDDGLSNFWILGKRDKETATLPFTISAVMKVKSI